MGYTIAQRVVTLIETVESLQLGSKSNQGINVLICTKSSKEIFQRGNQAAHRVVRLCKTRLLAR